MLAKLFAPLLIVALLTGCAATPAAPTASASPSSNNNGRGVDPFAEFEIIAGASCEIALSLGVIESMPSIENPEWIYIMVPKEQGIDGFSAVGYNVPKDESGIFYETGYFESCYFGQFFSLAREGGEDPAKILTVTYDVASDSYTANQVVDDGTAKKTQSTQFFMNSDGLFGRVKYLDEASEGFETFIEYREATEAERAILQKAATAELKLQSEQ
jgi:hypothetical protein